MGVLHIAGGIWRRIMGINIIRIETPWSSFDDIGATLTKEQETEINEISGKAFEEFKDFCDD